MPYDSQKHARRSIRLKDYDYSQAGAYFVTLVVKDRVCILGGIDSDGILSLGKYGDLVRSAWQSLPEHFPSVELDAYVVMPNHLHGVLVFSGSTSGAGEPRPYVASVGDSGLVQSIRPMTSPTLGQVVGYFKYQTTKQINLAQVTQGVPVWQRNYYEHVIRDEADLLRVRRYVENNPLQWVLDEENPERALS